MIAFELLGLVVAFGLGGALVSVLWPADRSVREDAVIVLPLGAGVGLFLSSATYWSAVVVAGIPGPAALLLDAGIAATLGFHAWRRWSAGGGGRGGPGASPLTWIHGTLFAQGAILVAIGAWRTWCHEPLGDGDAWAIWNMHARLLHRAGESWVALAQSPQLAWTHADYPLLVPASVARLWAIAGAESTTAAALVSASFAVALVALLAGAAGIAAGARAGWAAGLVLAGTPFFGEMAAGQHADLPCGFFILAVIALLVAPGGRAGRAAVAGLAAGGAAWTKNEGLMFSVAAGGVWLAHVLGAGRRDGRAAVAFVIAFVAATAPVLAFKASIAPANDVISGATLGRLGGLVDGARWSLVLSSMLRDSVGFGQWGLLPLPFLAVALLFRGPRAWGAAAWSGLVLAGLTLAGYTAAYLLTPHDLKWHLDSSLVRLLFQLWPSVLLLWALALPRAGGVAEPRTNARPARRPWVWLAGNAAAAVIAIALFRVQLSPHELAAGRLDSGAAVSVATGAGWHGVETAAGRRWAWSGGGDSALELHAAGLREGATATLRFKLRALAPRKVTIFANDAQAWTGEVGEASRGIELRDIALAGPVTRLVFSSDAEPVAEGSAPGARRLDIAVEDLAVD